MHLYLIHAVDTAGQLCTTHQCIVVAYIPPVVFMRGLTFHPPQCLQLSLKNNHNFNKKAWNKIQLCVFDTHHHASKYNLFHNLYYKLTVLNFIRFTQSL